LEDEGTRPTLVADREERMEDNGALSSVPTSSRTFSPNLASIKGMRRDSALEVVLEGAMRMG
jgi:hypothetical protein